MIRWRLYDNNPMREMLEQMAHMAGQAQPRSGKGEPMPINVHQTEGEVVIDAALPGVQPEAIDLSCDDGILTVRAHSGVEEREYFHQEIHPIEYLRQVMLPVECRFADAAATFEHGMLEIRIPKQRPKPPERIHIQVNRRTGPTTIEAGRGDYDTVRTVKTVRAPRKKVSGGGSATGKAGPGSRSGPAR